MLNIKSWTGRVGNNILQLLRSIHYAILNDHRLITFNEHFLLTGRVIEIENIKTSNKLSISDTFFSLNKYKIIDPEPWVMKEYFKTYINPIFKIKIQSKKIDDTSIYIHFRGGDIFSRVPHSAYVQPPLSYYKNIIKTYDMVQLVCEDKKNPCIPELLKQENVKYTSNAVEKDLSILSNVSNLIIGFGTFGFLLYLMNSNLKNLYIPEYFINELPTGEWGNDINIHIIKLPNYIKVGDWKNTIEQRKLMLTYK